jgi:hypothetical protein
MRSNITHHGHVLQIGTLLVLENASQNPARIESDFSTTIALSHGQPRGFEDLPTNVPEEFVASDQQNGNTSRHQAASRQNHLLASGNVQDTDDEDVIAHNETNDATLHSVTMVPDDHVSTTMYESACLHCNVVEIRTSPLGVHSDMVHCCTDNISFLPSTKEDDIADKNDTNSVVQVDDGSNTTTTNHRELLWNYLPIGRLKTMQDASGNCHDAVGVGLLLIPSNQPHGSVPIRAYYTPSIAATTISPSECCRLLGNAYKSHAVETDHDSNKSTMTLRHRLRRAQDIIISCTSRNGLSFTGPTLRPTDQQHTAPLTLTQLHARMIRSFELSDIDSIFYPCNDAPVDPCDDVPVDHVSAPVSNSVTATRPRINDPNDRVLFINHLNWEALRILWHQRLGHLHDRRVSEKDKYAIGVPDLPMASLSDQCPTCLAAKMRKAASGSDSSKCAKQCYQGLSIDFGLIIQASKNSGQRKETVRCNGETCYVLIADHFSAHGKAMKTKAPPLQYFHCWLSAFAPNCANKYVRTDQGGELG